MQTFLINRLIASGIITRGRYCLRNTCGVVLIFAIAGIFSPVFAQVPPIASQLIGVQAGIVNEFGELLKGTDRHSYEFGITTVAGDLVQILRTTNNTVYPPGINGAPDPRNEVVATTRIGVGVSPKQPRSGKFSSLLAPRPDGNTRIFVRVFNAPTLEEASFYGDSQIFTVSSFENAGFTPNITATDKPLDPADSDGDGLSNSWEKSIGSDPYMADSDGDGVSDADEYISGTDPMNEDSSQPEFVRIEPAGPGMTRLVWWPSVKDRTYRIYHSSSLQEQLFNADILTTIVTTGTLNAVVFSNSLLADHGTFHFRVSK